MRTALALVLGSMLLSVGLSSCATVDPGSVQAKGEAPVAAQVAVLELPYDPALPKFVVAIEPFVNGAQGSEITSGNGAPTAPSAVSSFYNFQARSNHYRYRSTRVSSDVAGGNLEGTPISSHAAPGDRIGDGISAQFMTALTRWGNVSVVDWAAITCKDDGTITTKLQPGEVGPFIVRGTLTEFNETSDLGSKNREVSGGLLGTVASSLGAGSAGMLLSQANPTYKNQTMTRNGMVGLDLTIMDGRTARILRSYNSSGTFTTKSATSGMSVFGIGGGDAQFAASALGQATRAAMNDAVKQTAEVLRTSAR
jgi:curli biogenesis system outer membrane secretion channel CsgG